MASDLTRPMPSYGSRYPPYSGAVDRAGRRPAAADEDGRGSFGPVLVVLSVISFLAVSACITGRLCGRRPSTASSRGEQQRGGTAAHADAEKGFGVMPQQRPAAPAAAVMRPVPSSRATVHDVDDDVFEIKLCAPVKPPAGRQGSGGGDDGGRALPRPLPAVPLGLPRQYVAAAVAAAAGFRGSPSASGGAAVRLAHLQVLGRANGGAPFVHRKQSR